MRGHDLLQEFDGLSEQGRRECVGYFLGGEGQIVDGFTDSQTRPDWPAANRSLNRFEKAIRYSQGRGLFNESMRRIKADVPIPGEEPIGLNFDILPWILCGIPVIVLAAIVISCWK